MKKLIFIFSALFIAVSCSKSKAPEPFLSEDCPDTVKFSTQILPMISDNCFSCHNNGQSPAFSDYASIMSNADNMLKAMKGEGIQMPQGADPLHDTLIQQFSCWISQGKQNN